MVSSDDEDTEQPGHMQSSSHQPVNDEIPSSQLAPVVVGTTETNGKLCFLINWPGKEMLELVENNEAVAKYSREIIKYYESLV